MDFHQSQNRPDEISFHNLDASLKKNISFVKKLKTISYEQKDTIWQEAAALKSDKYISEIVTSLLEAKLARQADFVAVIEVGLDVKEARVNMYILDDQLGLIMVLIIFYDGHMIALFIVASEIPGIFKCVVYSTFEKFR